MGKVEAHPKEHGIVPNKEGTKGAQQMEYKVENTHFIIVLDEDSVSTVNELRKHDKVDEPLLDTLAIDDIYAEKVGEKASEQQLDAAFGTTDKKKIVKQIMLNGKYH